MFEERKESEELARAVAEAKGTDPKTEQKIAWLKDKWTNPRYKNAGEETNLMHSILFMPAQPIHSAVISDNITYFKANYKYNSEFIELFLQEACLCGSKNIAEYLLKGIKSSYKERPELLVYVAASMNLEWAKEIAHALIKENISMPIDIYRLTDGAELDTIIEIFKAASEKPSAAPLTFSNDGKGSLPSQQLEFSLRNNPYFNSKPTSSEHKPKL